jgi:hypothetical protein
MELPAEVRVRPLQPFVLRSQEVEMRKIGYLGIILCFVVAIGLISASGASGQVGPTSDTSKRFVGTWRLVSILALGKDDPLRGPHPTGLIHYDATGYMAVQIMPDRARPKYAGALPTPNEARAAIIGYSAYFGTYTIDEQARTVTHHRTGNINPGGFGDFVRRYEFAADDRLILRPLENMNALTWERVR